MVPANTALELRPHYYVSQKTPLAQARLIIDNGHIANHELKNVASGNKYFPKNDYSFTPGQHTLRLEVDYNDRLSEQNEMNNVFEITVSANSDISYDDYEIIFSNFAIDGESYTLSNPPEIRQKDSDEPFEISFGVRNNSPDMKDIPYTISLDGVVIKEGVFQDVRRDVPGEFLNHIKKVQVVIPLSNQIQGNIVEVKLDPNNQTFESDEQNNSFSQKLNFQNAIYNLVIAESYVNSQKLTGTNPIVTHVADQKAHFRIPVILSDHIKAKKIKVRVSFIDDDGLVIPMAMKEDVVAADTSVYYFEFESFLRPNIGGQHKMIIEVDPNNNIAESNKQDNTLSFVLDVHT
jgi:hypothetical protein